MKAITIIEDDLRKAAADIAREYWEIDHPGTEMEFSYKIKTDIITELLAVKLFGFGPEKEETE